MRTEKSQNSLDMPAKHKLNDADRAKAKASRDRTISALKQKMLKALYENRGFVSLAAKEAGIDRSTHQKWMNSDLKYAEQVLLIQEDNLDFHESNLFKQSEGGNVAATIFYLKNKGASRGYGQRMGGVTVETTLGEGGGATVTNLVKLTWADEDEDDE